MRQQTDSFDMSLVTDTAGRSPVEAAYSGRRVLVIGHTGFMGGWLCEWLLTLGAQVTGFALPPDTEPSIFGQLHLADRMDSVFGDIRNAEGLKQRLLESRPDFVFHVAGQTSVKRAYRQPVLTWQTNVLGTVHLLDALRALDRPCAVVLVNTDSCYETPPGVYGLREDDRLGGSDPCAASRSAAEMATAAWRRGYFEEHLVRIATVRTGPTIGGGDWSGERLVPECARAWVAGRPVRVRHPDRILSWQHVLEPLSGCLWLAACLLNRSLESPCPARPGTSTTELSADRFDVFNLGPGQDAQRSIREVLAEAEKLIGAGWTEVGESAAAQEDSTPRLSAGKAAVLLGWRPVWTYLDAVRETIRWYFDVAHATDPELGIRLTRDQIEAYVGRARDLGLPWACEKSPA